MDDLTGMLRLSEGQAQVDMVEELKIENAEVTAHPATDTQTPKLISKGAEITDSVTMPAAAPEQVEPH